MRDVEKAVERKRVWSTSRYETFPDEGRKIEEAPVDSIIPSFRLGKQVAESARLRDGLGEGCDERCEPMLGHVGDQFV